MVSTSSSHYQSSQNLHKLVLGGQQQQFEKGTLIQESDRGRHGLYYINSGYVKRYSISAEGTKSVQVIYGPGDFFPLTLALNSLLDQSIYQGLETYYYETMDDAELVAVDAEILNRAIDANPILYRDILAVAGNRLHSNIQRLENQSLENTYKKVAHQLIFYARRFGRETQEGTEIMVPLTHQDIAEVLSVARETVTREMAKLRDKGSIKVGGYIILSDLEELEWEVHG